MYFRFLDPGPLVDQELELVPPQLRWVDDLLLACQHPQTIRQAPDLANLSRRQLLEFLQIAPLGHQRAVPEQGIVPSYHFWMRLHDQPLPAPLRIAGVIALRIGQSRDLEYYIGHIGYHVYPAARGHHYAERASRLLLPLARAHGLKTLWITCNPDNFPSRRTCERLGAKLVEVVPLPKEHLLYVRGERQKCRYMLEL